jgi:hypothetical protein
MRTAQPRGAAREPGAEALGLVANGSSALWDVAIDETIAGKQRWFASIEGPNGSLYFEIASPQVVEDALRFLERGPDPRKKARGDTLRLGKFQRASVTLLWDDEYRDRCFLVLGASNRPGVRLSLDAQQVAMLLEALRQVREDLAAQQLLS